MNKRDSETINGLLFIGGQLANCAFNLSQGVTLQPSDRVRLKSLQVRWDEYSKPAREMLNRPKRKQATRA